MKLSSLMRSGEALMVPLFAQASYRLYAKELCKAINALKISELELAKETVDALDASIACILAVPVHDELAFPYLKYLRSFDTQAAALLEEIDLALPHISEEEQDMFDLKRNALNVGMHLGEHLGEALFVSNALQEVCYLLGWQLTVADRDKAKLSEDARVSLLVPTLVSVAFLCQDVAS
jgi:hypothetical protein